MGLLVDVHIQAGVPGERLDPFAHSRLRKVLETRAFNFDGSQPRETALGPDPVAALDEAGVDVICLIAGDYNRALPGAVESQEITNDHVAGIVARYPTRIVGTCSVDPIRDPRAAVREIEHRPGQRHEGHGAAPQPPLKKRLCVPGEVSQRTHGGEIQEAALDPPEDIVRRRFRMRRFVRRWVQCGLASVTRNRPP
jgi:hypothetical protein